MPEAPPSRWRGWIAGSLFLLALIAALFVARQQPRPAEPAEQRPPAEAEPVPAAEPPPAAPLGRGDLVEAVQRARDAYAAGAPSPPANAALTGRRLRLAMPFACRTNGTPDGVSAKVDYDPGAETLRIEIRPQGFTDAPFLRALASARPYESAEGFWLDRPWTSSESCPAQPAAADAAPAAAAAGEAGRMPEPERSVAIVRFFEPGAPRSERRDGRAYRLVRKIAAGELDLARGLRLIVEGRLAELAAGQPIGCWSQAAASRPVCVAAVQVDRIAVTDAGGKELASWSS